jgi:DNA-binding transcriptional regulator YbjK
MSSPTSPNTSSPTQERSRARRDALLRAAIELLAEGGARAVTHRAVASRAGVPVAATTYYFETIGKLTEEALRLHVDERVHELRELVTAAAIGGRSVTQIAERFINALISRDSDAIIAQFEVYLEAARNPALRECVAEAIDASEQLAFITLTALGARRPAEVAAGFVAVVNGFALTRLARPRAIEVDAKAMLETLRAVFMVQIMDDDTLDGLRARLDQPLRIPTT